MKTHRGNTGIKTGSIIVALLLFLALILVPMATLFADLTTAGETRFATIRTQLFDASLQAAFLRTAATAMLACVLASAVAIPAALLLRRVQPWLRTLFTLLGLLPLAMPPMLTAGVLRHWIQTGPPGAPQWLTGMGGLGGAELQLIIVYALHYFPLLLLSMLVTQRDNLQDAIDAARCVGAGAWRILRHLSLPMALPGYLLGATLMLLRMLEDAATPLVLGIDGMLAPRVLQGLLQPGPNAPGPLVDAALLTVTTGLVVLLAWQLLQRPISADSTPPIATAPRRTLGMAAAITLPVVGIAVALALLPYVGLALIAIDASAATPAANWHPLDPETLLVATLRTLVFALFAGLLAMPTSAVLGRFVAAPGRPARWLRHGVTAVLAVPSIVLAFALLSWTRRNAGAALPINAAWVILSLVVVLKLLPLSQSLVAARWRSLDPELRATTQALGSATAGRFGASAFRAMAPLVLLTFTLATVGVLTEINAALALLSQPDVALVVVLYDAIRMGSIWPMPSLMLTLCVLGTLALSVALWHIANGRRRRVRGCYREELNPL